MSQSFTLAERVAAYQLVENVLKERRAHDILAIYHQALSQWAQTRHPEEVSHLHRIVKEEITASEWTELVAAYEEAKPTITTGWNVSLEKVKSKSLLAYVLPHVTMTPKLMRELKRPLREGKKQEENYDQATSYFHEKVKDPTLPSNFMAYTFAQSGLRGYETHYLDETMGRRIKDVEKLMRYTDPDTSDLWQISRASQGPAKVPVRERLDKLLGILPRTPYREMLEETADYHNEIKRALNVISLDMYGDQRENEN